VSRTRSFDESVVLSAAMHAFRRSGYGSASIRDIEEATGLSVGSLYNAYGDKQGLFDAAFSHYVEAVLRKRISKHAPADAGLGGVRELFVSLLHEPRGERFGCLITNSAVEFGLAGDIRQEAVRSGFEILRAVLQERLEGARKARALRSSVMPAVAAVSLVAFYQGVLVLVRSGYDKGDLRRAIDAEFALLEKGKL
jgi:TetR/AcrR family transcriptional regulator, transcriptional repressor for nem operon